MLNLFWKEWNEQSWKLGFGCIVLSAIAIIGLHARIVPDGTMVMSVCFLGMTLLPVLSSTGLLPAERAEGTFESLLALPVSPRTILLAKTEMGLLLCIGPMAVAAIVSTLFFGDREMTTYAMLALYTRSTLTAVTLFIWMLALTARLPNETRAGLIAIGILVIWLLATLGLAEPRIDALASCVSPFSFIYESGNHDPVMSATNSAPFVAALLVQSVMSVLLWFWTSHRLVDAVE